jgi:cytochrome P450
MPATVVPPGPKGYLFLGSLPDFRRDMLGFFARCAWKYGDCVAFRLGWKPCLFINHPDLIEQVLVTDHRRFTKRTFALRLLVPMLGNGLLTSEGDFWLRQRRLAQPAFHPSRIAAYSNIMVSHTERLLARWRDGETRDVHAEMMSLALGIVAKTLFDAEVGEDVRVVGEALDRMMAYFSSRFEGFFPMPPSFPTPANLRLRRAVWRLNEIVYRIIQERRTSGADRGDLLSMLLHAQDEGDGSQMTDQQLRDEFVTLFLAGHETTANALSWTWYLLAQHPEVEAKLAAELHAVLGGRSPTLADLPRLAYTERVVLESMRLFPPVWGFGREALEEVELGGYRIAPGTTVMMLQWTMHRHPRYFDNPDAFEPDRWADGLAKRLPKYAYFPFGGGPRICIGNSFAMMEAVLVLATLAQQFRFTLVPGQRVIPWPSITLRPKGGIRTVLARR